MAGKYDKMTHDDEVRIISAIIDKSPASALLDIPGVWEEVREHYNNEMLDRWDAEQAEASDDESEDD